MCVGSYEGDECRSELLKCIIMVQNTQGVNLQTDSSIKITFKGVAKLFVDCTQSMFKGISG